MSLVVVEDASLGFAGRVIFENLGLRIGESDRIGLVGPNGSGKTSLLRVLCGQQSIDKGKVQLRRGAAVTYLPQDIEVAGGMSLREYVLSSVPGRSQLENELREAEAGLEIVTNDDEMMEVAGRVAELHERIDHFDKFFSEHEALTILSGLGFTNFDRDVGEFSGGWKMRAVLGSLLFQQPDVMLLDEPTNHLDMPSVAWFSDFLKKYQRSFVLISHDREFLNAQIARVVSFEPEGVRQYPGNHDRYIKQRAEEEIILQNKAKNLAREREHMQRFIDRFRAQANKAAAVQSRVKALMKMEDVETYVQRRTMRFSFPEVASPVTEVIRGEDLSKRYGEECVFGGVDLVVRRGQRIAILGANGAGKTTLLRILAQEMTPTTGTVRLGNKVRLGYYAQHHADTLHSDSTIYQQVLEANPSAKPALVRNVLGGLLFSGDDVDKKISVLSGGERARVALARLLIDPGNVLLMDEPTNHLDLDSSERLASGLRAFQGTLLFVSHNMSLVRQLATSIWNLEDGKLEVYDGSLDEYLYSCRQRVEAKMGAVGGVSPGASPAVGKAAMAKPAPPVAKKRSRDEEKQRKRDEAKKREERGKELRPLEKKVAELEARIAALESEQSERSALLADADVYQDEVRRDQLLSSYQSGVAKMEELNARWEAALSALENARNLASAGT